MNCLPVLCPTHKKRYVVRNNFYVCLECSREEGIIYSKEQVEIICSVVIDYFQINRRRVFSKSRLAPIITVRHVIFYICKIVYGIEKSVISEYLKCTKHIIDYGAREISKDLEYRTDIQKDIEAIRIRLSIENAKKDYA